MKNLLLVLILLASPLIAKSKAQAEHDEFMAQAKAQYAYLNDMPCKNGPCVDDVTPTAQVTAEPTKEGQSEMSACEKQMTAILKEMKKKPVDKRIYKYVLIAYQDERRVSDEVMTYLNDGRWELYGSPTGDGKGNFAQALIMVRQ